MDRIVCYHSPAVFAFCGQPFTVQLFLPDEDATASEVALCYTYHPEEGRESTGVLRMLPVDGFCAEDSFSLYSATIPAKHLARRGELIYHFAVTGCESDTYRVPFSPMPQLPPLVITECCAWGPVPTSFLELHNPREKAVDLFDFELLLHTHSGTTGRNPLADRKGQNVLPPHGVALFRFLSPALYRSSRTTGDAKADLLTDLATVHPAAASDLSKRKLLVMQATTAQNGGEGGEKTLRADCFELFRSTRAHRLYLVPRGGKEKDAVQVLAFGEMAGRCDVRKGRSSLWRTDPRTPAEPLLYTANATVTPGYADELTAYLDIKDTTPPAILPLSPEGRLLLSQGDAVIRFFAAGRATGYPTVFVRGQGEYCAYPATQGKDGVFFATVPADVLAHIGGKLQYYIEVTGGLYTARYGSPEAPLSVRVMDNAGPTLTRIYPAEGQVLDEESDPALFVGYEDPSGVNLELSILCLDGRNVSEQAEWSENGVSFLPKRPLSEGEHSFEVSLRDMVGNRTYRRVGFSVCHAPQMQLYRGEIHSHTGESDGEGEVAEALSFARDTGRVDFFAVTDHSHFLTPAEYHAQIKIADSFNENGRFAALYGYEMTWKPYNGRWGHLNVLGSRTPSYPWQTDLPEMYGLLANDPAALAQFNHPGDEWGDFDEFGHRQADTGERVCLCEVKNASYDRLYALMLSKGWRAAPTFNEDNHQKNWTQQTDGTTVVLAPSLTRENVMEALRRRRTYATMDKTMQIKYRVNGKWMGSVLECPAELEVEIDIKTRHKRGIGRIELVSEDNIVLAEMDAGTLRRFRWDVELDPDFDYYYLRITNGDCYTVTAPVFITGRDKLNIVSLSHGAAKSADAPFVVEATVKNEGERPMQDVRVDFYQSSPAGFELRRRAPLDSVHIGRLDAGEARTVSRSFADLAGQRRISAVVSGSVGKTRFADTGYLLLSPLYITKLMPLTAPFEKEGRTVENPFPFVELYNPMFVPCNLRGMELRPGWRIGREPTGKQVLDLGDVTIPPRSTLVVWQRGADSPLDVADFNTRFGTMWQEGKQIIVTSQSLVTTDRVAARLDIFEGDALIARVAYGKQCGNSGQLSPDVPLLFSPRPGLTASEAALPTEPGARPGRLIEAQRLREMDGTCRPEEQEEAQKVGYRKKATTALLRAPMIPFQAASLVAGAVSSLKSIFTAKE